jgi:hypothetical protein
MENNVTVVALQSKVGRGWTWVAVEEVPLFLRGGAVRAMCFFVG